MIWAADLIYSVGSAQGLQVLSGSSQEVVVVLVALGSAGCIGSCLYVPRMIRTLKTRSRAVIGIKRMNLLGLVSVNILHLLLVCMASEERVVCAWQHLACCDISQHLTLELMRQQACVTTDHGRMTKVNLPGIAGSLPRLECCFCIQLPFVCCTHGRAVVRSAFSVHSFLLCAHHDRVAEFCSHRYASQASPVIPTMQQSMCITSNTVHGTYRCHLCRVSYVLEPCMCPAQPQLQVQFWVRRTKPPCVI